MKTIASLAFLALAGTASAQYTTLNYAADLNTARNDALIANGGTFPTGAQTFDSVPFQIGNGPNVNDPWAWSGVHAVTGGPATLVIPVNIFGVSEAYSLINTFWGANGLPALAAITFNATNGVTYTKDLVGNDDIRDYNQWIWTNSINGITTKQVFNNNQSQRLDMQTFALPAAFANETLLNITVSDTGATDVQRLIVAGMTVKVVPAPASGLAMVGGLGLLARRRR